MKKKDIINIFILIFVLMLILFFKVGFKYINGSTIDFISQHSVFPDYFRILFYNTKSLLPSFAFNIGAGQNIFNFSYYGLLSPMVLISYLFPFIKMINFIQIYIILSTIVSIILMYYFLRKRYDEKYSFIGTLLFLLSGPIIFHTSRHIMFINYMPFLVLSLINVDKYFEENKKSLLILSVFLLIMSSYYYSIPSIICIILYAIYKYIEKNELNSKIFIKDGLKFIFVIFISIMMSMILLLPTLYAIKNGRADITNKVSILSALLPKFEITKILYNAYSIGTTSIILIAIIYQFFNSKKDRFISLIFILIILFPIFMYSLNGFMYVRGKVMIPLLPIAILLITDFLNNFKCYKNRIIELIVSIIIFISIITFIINKLYIFTIEILLLYLSYILSLKNNNKKYLVYYVVISSVVCCLVNNSLDVLAKKSDINYEYTINDFFDKDNIYRVSNLSMNNINRVIDKNYYLTSVYSSLENSYYYDFFKDKIFSENNYNISTAISSKNILFNTLMGTKYIISDDKVLGYEKVENLYVNDKVLPIGFFTDKILDYNTYNKLNDEEKAYALVTNIVIDEEKKYYENKGEEIELDYTIIDSNVDLEKNGKNYIINSKDNGYIKINIDELDNKLLFISFDMEYMEDCNIGDTSVSINGITNILSCNTWEYPNNNNNFKYVINEKELKELNILFSKGKYIISNIKTYIIDNNISEFVNTVSEFKFNKEMTKGDKIKGNIYAYTDGYFMISIPYDKGFNILVDDKKVDYNLANESFIAFPLNEGNHDIDIIYKAPFLNVGKIISSIGFILFIYIAYLDINKNKTN